MTNWEATRAADGRLRRSRLFYHKARAVTQGDSLAAISGWDGSGAITVIGLPSKTAGAQSFHMPAGAADVGLSWLGQAPPPRRMPLRLL